MKEFQSLENNNQLKLKILIKLSYVIVYKFVMKKQKFEVYAQPVWKNIVIPARGHNESKMSTKSRKMVLRKGKTFHKYDSNLPPRDSQHEFPCIKLSDEEDIKDYEKKDIIRQFSNPKGLLLRRNNRSAADNKSRSKNNEMDNFRSTKFEFNAKRTISSGLKQHSNGKMEGCVTWSKDQFRELRLKQLSGSPYLKNISDISKIVKMLKPVKGPNESIRKQIVQFNSLNKKKHELVVMRRPNQTFEMKRQVYLERIGLQPTNKVFVMNSRDYHIREALIKRGWIELEDISDSFFHLKWVYSDTQSDYQSLHDGQLFNHFHNNQELTNKNNLRKNVKAVVAMQNQPRIPLTFDLGIGVEYKQFSECLMLFEGVKILNMIINSMKSTDSQRYKRIVSNPNYFKFLNYNHSPNVKQKRISIYDLFVYEVCQKETKILIQKTVHLISFMARMISKESSIKYAFYFSESKLDKKQNILAMFQYFEDKQIQQKIRELPNFLKVQLCKVHFHLMNGRTTYRKCYGTENSWIVKPTGVSRGTGIHIESDFRRLLFQENNQHGKIFQKYIEKPFLLKDGRKFDLRQWVLVRSFQPFEVYIFDRLYGRICPQKYFETDFENNQRHLTNYSLSREYYKNKNAVIQKNAELEKNSILFNHVSLRRTSQASIVLQQDLVKEIHRAQRTKDWAEIKLQIKSNIVKTLRACSGNIDRNVSCFEVYGFDILLDEDLGVHVIEVNLSPACEKRQGLEVYLEQMGEGLVGHVENWLGLSDDAGKKASQEGKFWQRIDPVEIQRQLGQLSEDKIKNEKATIIQKWVRSFVLKQLFNQ